MTSLPDPSVTPSAIPSGSAGEAAPGSPLVAGRYRLLGPLIDEGTSEVYRAKDELTDEQVVVKLLPNREEQFLARLRTEVSALRLLHLPGVARLLDEGMHGDRAFLTMELVPGHPFPGPDCDGTWASMRATVVLLLEILARVHAMGLVHRDLKPDNVLVDGQGRPTVLDFGLSAGRAIGAGLEPDRTAVGTPAYASPEQIRGEEADASSDLYALGVMLYEVLAGHGPQVGTLPAEIIAERLRETPKPLRHAARDAPAFVCELVDRLLDPDPRHRPRSALDVLRSLRRQESESRADASLPWLGGREALDRVLACARAGRSVELCGDPGSGRTRHLGELAERLRGEGRAVIGILPSPEPFGGLEALEGWRRAEPGSIDEAFAVAEDHLRAELEAGTVLLVEDWNDLDRWSARALERCLHAGCLVIVRGVRDEPLRAQPSLERIQLEPLEQEDLRPLFAGPDRLFHLRKDGARELWLRTGGNPGRVSDETNAWVRAGWARWSGAELAVGRQVLNRLRTGGRLLALEFPSQPVVASLGPSLEEHLVWVSLTTPNATGELIAKLRGQAVWMVNAEAEDLIEAGALRRLPDGRLEALVIPRRLEEWSEEERREAHARIAQALPPSSEGRLFHLFSGAQFAEVPGEVMALAERLIREGRLGEAEAALTEGLHAVRQLGDAATERRLFREWVCVALMEFTSQALDRLLYELARAIQRDGEVLHMEELVHAAVVTFEADGERALAEVDKVERFEDLELERWRQGLRLQAARRCSQEREEQVLAEVSAWAQGVKSVTVQASLLEWTGRLRYRQDRYREAAEFHAGATRLADRVHSKLSTMLNGASALMEAFCHDEAVDLAARARDLAASCRHSLFEARAEWLLRSVQYRRGATTEPDLELADAANRIGVTDQEALICLTEAAVAWRGEHLEAARRLADRTVLCWSAVGKVWGSTLARSLSLASGTQPRKDELKGLTKRLELCPFPVIAGQSLALLRQAGVRPRRSWRALAKTLREEFPEEQWGERREILCVTEMLEGLGG